MKYIRCAFAVLLLAVALGPQGVAATPAGLTPEQGAALEQRVRQRWQTLADHEYDKTWEFETPIYRGVFPKELYTLQFSYAVERELTAVEVVNYDAAAAVASVAVRVMSRPTKLTSDASKAMGAVPITINEKWIFVDGKWWHSANN